MKNKFLKLIAAALCTLFSYAAFSSAPAKVAATSVEEKSRSVQSSLGIRFFCEDFFMDKVYYVDNVLTLKRIKGKMMIGKIDNKQVGLVTFCPCEGNDDPCFKSEPISGPKATIECVHVPKSEWRRKGIGSLFVQKAVAYIKKMNREKGESAEVEIRLNAVPLDVFFTGRQSMNVGDLIKFYEKNGAQLIKQKKDTNILQDSQVLMKFSAALQKDNNAINAVSSSSVKSSEPLQQATQQNEKQALLKRIKFVKRNYELAPKSHVKKIVALLDGKEIGCITFNFKNIVPLLFTEKPFAGNKASIEDLAVKKEFRRHGVGALLVQHALAYIKRKNNNEPVQTRVIAHPDETDPSHPSMSEVIAFYKKCGAQEIGPIKLLGLDVGILMKFPEDMASSGVAASAQVIKLEQSASSASASSVKATSTVASSPSSSTSAAVAQAAASAVKMAVSAQTSKQAIQTTKKKLPGKIRYILTNDFMQKPYLINGKHIDRKTAVKKIVAKIDDKEVGSIILCPTVGNDDLHFKFRPINGCKATIENIDVIPQLRRNGIASRLLQQAIAYIKRVNKRKPVEIRFMAAAVDNVLFGDQSITLSNLIDLYEKNGAEKMEEIQLIPNPNVLMRFPAVESEAHNVIAAQKSFASLQQEKDALIQGSDTYDMKLQEIKEKESALNKLFKDILS